MSDAPKLPKGLPVESFDPGDLVYTEKDMEDFRAAGERAARAAAFREAADLCERWSDKWRPDVPVRDRYADGLSSGASELADALRARAEGDGEKGR